MSMIRLKWMCFVLFPTTKATDCFSLRIHLLLVSTTWTSFSNNMEPRHTSILKSVLTSLLIVQVIGVGVLLTMTLLPWPPQSPDLTPYDFFVWGYIRDCVYVPPMPCNLPQLQQSFMEAVTAINHQMWQRAWQELDHRIDICHVIKVDMSSTCNPWQKPLPLLTCSPSTWPSQLLYRRSWKSQRDLLITLNIFHPTYGQ
jgi:hypothetical protein